VIDTDEIARFVVEPGQPALEEICVQFGAALLTPDGHLDRRAMRRLIFDDATQRPRLEAILHPRIRHETLERAERAGGPYQVLVVPLLVESGFDQLTDRVLVIDCPRDLQEARLLDRDSEDPARIERILATQLSRDDRLRAADDVIDNSGTVEATLSQVEALHERYLTIAQSR
jgi:dephospho-CoA kinase